MIVLGIDFGSKRVGLAISDAEGEFAFPLERLERKGGARDFETLQELISERGVQQIVLGLPLHMSGKAGPEADRVRSFAAELTRRTGIPVDLIDERLTSAEAERALRATGGSGSKRRKKVDSVAATIILRTYLEQRRNLEQQRKLEPGRDAAEPSKPAP